MMMTNYDDGNDGDGDDGDGDDNNYDGDTYVLLATPPAMGSTYTGSSGDRLHSHRPRCTPRTSRCSSGGAAGRWTRRWRRRKGAGGRGEWKVRVCDWWPLCSDSPSCHSEVALADKTPKMTRN